MKLFVYGKLQSTKSRGWLIPFSKNKQHTLRGYKMYLLPTGSAATIVGDKHSYVKGEIREVKRAVKFIDKLLLFILDLSEGTFWDVYERVKINDMWVYLYKKSVITGLIIHRW